MVARVALGAQRVGADEVLAVERAHPAEPGLEGRVRLVEVVAVERIADLEAQRVARPETRGRGARRGQPVPQRPGPFGGHEQLDAGLAGVAGAGDDRAHAAHLGLGEGERLERRQLDEAGRGGALQREHRDPLGQIVELDAVRQVADEPLAVGVDARGVDDQQHVVVGEPVGDQVVDRAAALVQEQRVLGMAGADAVEVVREHPLDERDRPGAADLELAHVRDVEDPGVPAHRAVLRDDPLVLHRHLPAGKGDHPCSRGHVAVVERRAAKGLGRVHPDGQSTGSRGGGDGPSAGQAPSASPPMMAPIPAAFRLPDPASPSTSAAGL